MVTVWLKAPFAEHGGHGALRGGQSAKGAAERRRERETARIWLVSRFGIELDVHIEFTPEANWRRAVLVLMHAELL